MIDESDLQIDDGEKRINRYEANKALCGYLLRAYPDDETGHIGDKACLQMVLTTSI